MKKITLFTALIMCINLSTAQTALEFDPATADPQVKILQITCPSEFTFEAWVFYIGRQGSDFYPTILEFGDDGPFFGLEEDALTLYDVIFTPETFKFPKSVWTHVAGTYSTANSEAKLYVNGVLVATETDVTLSLDQIGAGIGYNGSDNIWNGSIDDVRIWETIRNEAEILASMSTCLTGDEAGLYAFYNFDEGSGIIVNDKTANKFNGVLLNMDSIDSWVAYDSCGLLSIEDQNSDLQISLFPNPSSDFVSISGLRNETNYEVYNAIGSRVLKGTVMVNDKIDVQNLTSGIYLLKLESGSTLKFMKE